MSEKVSDLIHGDVQNLLVEVFDILDTCETRSADPSAFDDEYWDELEETLVIEAEKQTELCDTILKASHMMQKIVIGVSKIVNVATDAVRDAKSAMNLQVQVAEAKIIEAEAAVESISIAAEQVKSSGQILEGIILAHEEPVRVRPFLSNAWEIVGNPTLLESASSDKSYVHEAIEAAIQALHAIEQAKEESYFNAWKILKDKEES
jgi:flagellar hook-basal body complex protein FliE